MGKRGMELEIDDLDEDLLLTAGGTDANVPSGKVNIGFVVGCDIAGKQCLSVPCLHAEIWSASST